MLEPRARRSPRMPEPTPTRGHVLYDDSCGFCRRWVPFWANALARRGFAIAPLQSAWTIENVGLPEDERLRDLRLVLATGEQKVGADAYRHVMRRIGWARPLYALACSPGGRQAFDWGYRTFAANRHRVSRACRWQTTVAEPRRPRSKQASIT